MPLCTRHCRPILVIGSFQGENGTIETRSRGILRALYPQCQLLSATANRTFLG